MNCIKPQKLLSFLFCFLLMSLMSYGQSILDQKVSLPSKGLKVKAALLKLEEKADINFAFNKSVILDETVNESYENETIRAILKDLLTSRNLAYKTINNQIVIYVATNTKVETAPKKTQLIFSGYLYDVESGEAIIGANIYDKVSFDATVSNNFGFFSLALQEGEHGIIISFIGYESKEISISKTQQQTIKLQSATNILESVEVVAKNDPLENLQSAQVSTNMLTTAQIKNIPAIGGEADALKALTLLPGVKSGEEGKAGFYVRGGSADQNLILMDGIPLYNPYHLFGYLSTFNADAINNIEITKGGFPARYGGRLSSVLDITMQEGNNQEWKTKISLGLLSARATVSVPIVKDKSALLFSVRRSFLDLIYTPLAEDKSDDFKLKEKFNMADLNLKWNYKFSNKDRLFVSSYFSKDLTFFNEEVKEGEDALFKDRLDSNWRNGIASVRWNHLYNDKLFSNTTAYYTHYSYDFKFNTSFNSEQNVSFNEATEREMVSTINDFGLKQDFQYYLNKNNTVRFGASAIAHGFEVGVASSIAKYGQDTLKTTTTQRTRKATEAALYLEDEIAVNQRLKLNVGLHASAYFDNVHSYFSLQPRINASFLLNEKVSIKAAYAQMAQYIHLLSSGGLVFKTDFWIPTTQKITPELSKQFTLGTSIQLTKAYQLEVEGYYKRFKNLADYKPGSNLLTHNGNWEDVVAIGTGESYGAEFFLQKTKGRLTGWLGYTLSWAFRESDEINFGKKYYDTYDRRHDISLVTNYQVNKKWALNTSWVFATGGFTTLSYEGYTAPNYDLNSLVRTYQFESNGASVNSTFRNPTLLSAPNAKNNLRLPNYHKLDITVSRTQQTKRGNQSKLTFGLTNVYNKFNPTYYRKKQEFRMNQGNAKARYEGVAIFPLMPSFNYSITF